MNDLFDKYKWNLKINRSVFKTHLSGLSALECDVDKKIKKEKGDSQTTKSQI